MSASNQSNKVHLTDAVFEFTDEALDQFVYSSISDCSHAVHQLVGDAWGSSQFDVSPLLGAYMECVASVSEFTNTGDVHDVVKALLDASVSKAQDAREFPAMVNVNEFNPVGVLVAFMRASTALFIAKRKRDRAQYAE